MFQNKYIQQLQKGATNNLTLSWSHVIKFKAQTGKFHPKFITTM